MRRCEKVKLVFSRKVLKSDENNKEIILLLLKFFSNYVMGIPDKYKNKKVYWLCKEYLSVYYYKCKR